MKQAIRVYRSITAADEFKEMERSRSRHNETSELRHAVEVERKKWQSIVADKNATLADKDAEIARLRAQLNNGE
jgi:hypothetical protein